MFLLSRINNDRSIYQHYVRIGLSSMHQDVFRSSFDVYLFIISDFTCFRRWFKHRFLQFACCSKVKTFCIINFLTNLQFLFNKFTFSGQSVTWIAVFGVLWSPSLTRPPIDQCISLILRPRAGHVPTFSSRSVNS